MSFLAPLFLAGVTAAALPIIFHLIRRTPRGRIDFSSIMFLSPSPPRLTRRRRLENWPLLLLRILALCLIAAAFARPFLRRPEASDAEGAVARSLAVLVDTSASMRRGDLWPQALKQVKQLAADAGPADRLAVYAFDRRVRPIVSFEQWSQTPQRQRAALVDAGLADLKPGWGATDVGAALIGAADAIDELAAQQKDEQYTGPRRIVLISDVQQGAQLEALQAYDWPRGVDVDVKPLAVKATTNAGVQFVWDADDLFRTDEDDRPRARVSNAADSTREQLKLRWAASDPVAAAVEAVDVYVPPGQSRIVRAPAPPADAFGGSVGERLVIAGDDHDFDNTAYRVPPTAQQIAILYVGGDRVDDAKAPLYYLTRAFPDTRWRKLRVLARAADAPLAPGAEAGVQLVVITEPLPFDGLEWLKRYLARGRTALFVLRTPAVAANVAALIGADELTATEAQVKDYAMLGQIDFTHPLFAPFADPRFGDFTKIHIWQYRKLDVSKVPAAHVLASFDTGDPALVEIPLGKDAAAGRLLVLSTAWHPQDSQLALSSKFVPLIAGILDQSMGTPDRLPHYHVGDRVPLALAARSARIQRRSDSPGAADAPPPPPTPTAPATPTPSAAPTPSPAPATPAPTPSPTPAAPATPASPVVPTAPVALRVTRPDGSAVDLAAGDDPAVDADQPGVYSVAAAGAPDVVIERFAVNLAAGESQTTPIGADELERRGVQLVQHVQVDQAKVQEHRRQLQAAEMEKRHKIWRWLIFAALGVLVVETWLAGRAAGRASIGDEETLNGDSA